jgi:signal transduction histidine kinase
MAKWAEARPLCVDAVTAALVGLPLFAWSVIVLVPAGARFALSGALLTHVALAFRRRAPLPSFVAVSAGCAAMLAGALVGTDNLLLPPSMLLFPWALYALCAHGLPRDPACGLVVAVLGAAGIALAFWRRPGDAAGLHPVFVFVFVLAVTTMAWSLGLWRRTQRAYLLSLEDRARRAEAAKEERARRAVADERARIAREIHDVVSHSLSVVISQAQGGAYAVRADPGRASTILATIADAGRHALTDMRGLLGVLRPDTPLEADPQPTLADLPSLLDRTRAAGLAVTLHRSGNSNSLSPAAELAVYRLIQESLTNTLKHAGSGRTATVRLCWEEDALTVEVGDDGPGRVNDEPSGLGLIGMRERFQAFGGTVAFETAAAGGLLVTAHLPYRGRA